MKRILQIAALSLISWGATASELDAEQPSQRPSALVVREDASGNREIFKADLATAVTNDVAAASALASLSPEKTVKLSSELDRDASTEAWYGRWHNRYSYYYYSYHYASYSYYYYPTYNYWYGGYRYSYYWCY